MSICFVICYFGKLPIWFDAFLLSCKKNSTINWWIFTDSKIPNLHPENVEFQYLDLKQFNKLAQRTTQLNTEITNSYKLCDFKPLYGDIFSNYLEDYEYWGHCDLDLIWGNLEDFYKKIGYRQYEIISTRRNAISGHCTIYKNDESLLKLYKQIEDYQKPLLDEVYAGFDEGYFSYYVYTLLKETKRLKIYWPKDLAVERYTLRHSPLGWYWKDGKIFSKDGVEYLYLHFMNWKKTIKQLDFSYSEHPDKFNICRSGILKNDKFARVSLNNYPIKTPYYKTKYLLKKIIKTETKELSNYHLDYLKIEERYPQ